MHISRDHTSCQQAVDPAPPGVYLLCMSHRPWPKLLTDLFPMVDRHEDYPWWKRLKEGRDNFWVRSIGGEYILAEGLSDLAVAMLMDESDTSNPLPFPGIRVGQIWALPYGTEDGPDKRRIYTGTDVFLIGESDGAGDRFLVQGTWIPRSELLPLLDNEHAYLLSDILCPHLAPWSAPAKPVGLAGKEDTANPATPTPGEA